MRRFRRGSASFFLGGKYMREYFGDDPGEPCSHRDACESGLAAERDAFERARAARAAPAEERAT